MLTDIYPKYMQVIELIRQGRMPTRACREVGITWSSLRKAMTSDQMLSDLFVDALEEMQDQMFEALVTINDQGKGLGQLYSESDAKMATVISNNIKWVLERLKPEKYMPKGAQVDGGGADKAIIDALNAALVRIPLPAAPALPVLSARAPAFIDLPFEIVTPEPVLTLDDVL